MATHHDEINGYFIPAGTMIIGNSWYVDHLLLHTSGEKYNSIKHNPGESFTTQLFILTQADLIQIGSWTKAVLSISPQWTHSRFLLGMVAGYVLAVIRPKHKCGFPLLVC